MISKMTHYKLVLGLLLLLIPPVRAESIAPETLNNLVREPVNLNFPPATEEDYSKKPFKEISFEREKDGWVYVKVYAESKPDDNLLVTLDDAAVLPVNLANLNNNTAETMRFVKSGSHNIRIWVDGRPRLKNLTVRAVPEIIFFNFSHQRRELLGRDYSRLHKWDFLEKHVLKSYNVVASIDKKKFIPYIEKWHDRGGKWIAVAGISWGPTVSDVYEKWGKLMENPLYDGVIIDEFSTSPKYVEKFPLWRATMKRIKNNQRCRDKILYGFMGTKYDCNRKALLDMLFECGYKYVPEAYYFEMPTEGIAEQHLEKYLLNVFTEWKENYPNVLKDTIICLAIANVPPGSWNTCPDVNFKVFLDKQFYHLANDPTFKDLYGVTFFTAHCMDEEILRWFSKLIRHYLIDGNREMLGTDPYILTHLENPGFEQGERGWHFNYALDGSVKVINIAEMKFKKKYGWNAIPEGKRVLYTKRSGNKPNIISQKIKNLTPGSLYSLKVYNTDLNNFKEKKRISVSIQLKGVELLEDKSRHDVFTCTFPMTKMPGHETKVCWNSHYRVFRAKSESGELVLSDWETNVTSGGSANQEIIWDFIELQPYFAIEEYENMNRGIH